MLLMDEYTLYIQLVYMLHYLQLRRKPIQPIQSNEHTVSSVIGQLQQGHRLLVHPLAIESQVSLFLAIPSETIIIDGNCLSVLGPEMFAYLSSTLTASMHWSPVDTTEHFFCTFVCCGCALPNIDCAPLVSIYSPPARMAAEATPVTILFILLLLLLFAIVWWVMKSQERPFEGRKHLKR